MRKAGFSLVQHTTRTFLYRDGKRQTQRLHDIGYLLPTDEVPDDIKILPGHRAVLVISDCREKKLLVQIWATKDFRPLMLVGSQRQIPEEDCDFQEERLIDVEELTQA